MRPQIPLATDDANTAVLASAMAKCPGCCRLQAFVRARCGNELRRRRLWRRATASHRQAAPLPDERTRASSRVAVGALLNDAFNRRIDITHDLGRGRGI
jgi:hypothetical protein